jgi:hypothetical protein
LNHSSGAYWHESEILRAKSFDALDLGCVDQRTVKTIGPAVIAAPKELARAAAFDGWACPVAADVVEPAQLAIGAAHNE